MKNKILLMMLLGAFVFSACNKELDLSSSTYFGIKEFLKSKNCKTKCNQAADCEGKTAKLKGKIDPDNILEERNVFFLLDENDAKYMIEVEVDSAIVDRVFEKLNGEGGSVFKVEGTVTGVDAPTNYECYRLFVLHLSDAEKLIKEE